MADSQRDETQPLLDLPVNAGSRLRLAREAAGLTRADIAATTRIPERHIVSIEAGDFAALAGRSYALGFSRSYARAVGLDEQEIIRAVRQEMGTGDAEPEHRNAFEPGDPSRVPSKRIAWLAALIAFAVAVGMLFFWRSRSEGMDDPAPLDLASDAMSSETATPATEPAGQPSANPGVALSQAGAMPAVGDPVPAAVPPARLGNPAAGEANAAVPAEIPAAAQTPEVTPSPSPSTISQ